MAREVTFAEGVCGPKFKSQYPCKYPVGILPHLQSLCQILRQRIPGARWLARLAKSLSSGVLVRDLASVCKVESSCGRHSASTSGLQMHTFVHAFPHVYTHTLTCTHNTHEHKKIVLLCPSSVIKGLIIFRDFYGYLPFFSLMSFVHSNITL